MMREINLRKEKKRIISFIQKQLHIAGMQNLIIGISGGIDSALAAALCKESVGKDNLKAFLLPYKTSNKESLEDGILVAESLELHYRIIEITPMVDAYFDNYEQNADNLRRGNRMARERMCVLYDQSAKYKALVCGTGNKSELLTGYVTQYGDGACAFEPLGHLYKSEVFKLAEILNLPEKIIKKSPTADLWEDQTDEAELGMSYNQLDEILFHLYEKKEQKKALLKRGYTSQEIQRVEDLYKKSAFKRCLPPQPLLRGKK